MKQINQHNVPNENNRNVQHIDDNVQHDNDSPVENENNEDSE